MILYCKKVYKIVGTGTPQKDGWMYCTASLIQAGPVRPGYSRYKQVPIVPGGTVEEHIYTDGRYARRTIIVLRLTTDTSTNSTQGRECCRKEY